LSETLRSDASALVPADDVGGLLPWARRTAREQYVHLLLSQVLVGGTAMIANVLMARALAPSARGMVALLLQVAYIGSQLLLLGSERSFIAVYHGSSPAVAVRAYTSLVIGPCGAAVAAFALAAIVVPAQLGLARTVLLLVAAFTVVNVLVQAVRVVAIATGRHLTFLRSTVVGQLGLSATLTVLFLTGASRPSEWFLAYMIVGALPAIACWVLWSRATAAASPLGATTARPDQRRSVRREGLALFPASIANMGMLRLDRLLLPALASPAALGLYATVATMTELLTWPVQAYADSRLGRWRAAHGSGRLRVPPIVVGAAVYALVVAPAFGGLLYMLVVPLFGERYAPARALVLPLVAAAGLYAISRAGLGLLIAQGRNLLASAAEVCGFAASLVAYLILIPSQGVLGAAYGSLIGYGACLAVAIAALGTRAFRPASRPVPGEGR
jgi:O-antigen/teichoic acid export membrane protein